MPVRQNKVKQLIKRNETILSSSVRLPEPGLCELLGYAGFDFVLIDCEHGAIGWGDIDRMTQGCFAGGTVPMVRVLHNDDAETIMRVLDLGVQGILIPHCRTAEDARRLQQAAWYAPDGTRGFGPGRGAEWGRLKGPDYFNAVNDSLFLFALIEDPEGVDNVEEIAKTGLDCLWVGTGDLAMAYGVPGQRDHRKVREAAGKILDACKRHGVVAGYPAADAEDAKWARKEGFRAIGYGGAESYVMKSSRDFLSELGR
ncbi:MAG: hypothetical protein Tsb009_12000 [Planctomycetaceae bacterium]